MSKPQYDEKSIQDMFFMKKEKLAERDDVPSVGTLTINLPTT